MDIVWPEAATWSLRAAAVGGLLAVDGQACLHLVASQPLVAGVLAGLVFRDASLGLIVGAYLQLVWAYGTPAGRAPGPDAASGTVVGVGAATTFSSSVLSGGGHIAFGLLAAVAVAWAGARTENWRRRANEALANKALRKLREGDPGALGRAHLTSVALSAARGGFVAGVGYALVAVVGRVVFNRFAGMDFGAAFVLIPCLGIVSFFLGIVRIERKGLAFFAAGVVVALLAGLRVPFP